MSRTATSCGLFTQRYFNSLKKSPRSKTFMLTKDVPFEGWADWTDGTNYYQTNFWDDTGGLMSSPEHYVWNGNSWEALKWDWSIITENYDDVSTFNIWTDGTNIYFSNSTVSAVLRNGVWERKTWGGLPTHIYNFQSVTGDCIWTDGTHIYYSYQDEHLVLNGDTWEVKEWNGADYMSMGTFLIGAEIWTDNTNIYFSRHNMQYVLNKATDTWEAITWEGYSNPTEYSNFEYVDGRSIWTDGINQYLSVYGSHWIRNGYTWSPITFKGYSDFSGSDVFTDGENIYCMYSAILLPTSAKMYAKSNGEWVQVSSLS